MTGSGSVQKRFSQDEALAFVGTQTALGSTPLLPEIRLHLATEITPLWQAIESTLEVSGLPPPYWAFAWAGGQGLARYVLDHPEGVRGKRVLDFAAGSGIAGIAAALAGAALVEATELDPLAIAALTLNAKANGVAVTVLMQDVTEGNHEKLERDAFILDHSPFSSPPGLSRGSMDCRVKPGNDGKWVDSSSSHHVRDRTWDVVLAGDVCYERPMAERATAWLRRMADAGSRVLLGDPGRAYLPKEGLFELARYTVPTTRELEDQERRLVTIYRLVSSIINS